MVSGSLLFFLSALISGLISFVLVRRIQRKVHERRRGRSLRLYRQQWEEQFFLISSEQLPRHLDHLDHIGNLDCGYNAHSAYLRCAMNPMGPCEDCPSFQPKT
ncbi:MAG: DUF6464 family protein [Microcystaceae cyanobacterium]